MTSDAVRHGSVAEEQPAIPIGIPTLVKMAFDGFDLAPVWNKLVERVNNVPNDAAALLDLSTIAHIQGRPDDHKLLKIEAFELQRIFRQRAAESEAEAIRVLAFMSPGDFMANMPIEFLLENSNVTLAKNGTVACAAA